MGQNTSSLDPDFDPYYRWLGIPKGKRPVNHYQLLGVSRKEQDKEIIREAAERQKMVVKTFEPDPSNPVASRVLYEIEEASFVLLDNDFRSRYNAFLKEKKGKKSWSRAYNKWRKGMLKKSKLPEEYVTISQSSGFVEEFAIVFSIIFVGFVLMAAITFYFPWTKITEDQEDKPQPNQVVGVLKPAPVKQNVPEEKVEEKKPVENKELVPVVNQLPEEPAGGIVLFNGVNLKGWNVHIPEGLRATPEQCWMVNPETKVLKCLGTDHNWIETDKSYRNFILKLDWRFPEGTQIEIPGSGVMVRSNGVSRFGKWPDGIEAQIGEKDSGDFWQVDVPFEATRPSPENKRQYLGATSADKPVGQWNSMEVKCENDRITVSVNGKLVNEGWGTPATKGKICLLSQMTPLEFRNISLVELEDSSDSAVTSNTGVFGTLFDGKTFQGWKTLGFNNVDGWRIKNGELISKRQKNVPHLITETFYDDFEFQCDFWLFPKSNSGIYLRGLYEVQLLDDPAFPNSKPETKCCSIYGLIAPSKSAYKGAKKWNQLKVRLEDKIVTVILNGQTVIDHRPITKLTGGQYLNIPEGQPGPIAIQHYGDPVKFRKISISPLGK